MRTNRWFLFGAALVLLGIIVGANLGQYNTIQQVQKTGAEHQVLDEAQNIVAMVPDIGNLVQTGRPDATQAAAITTVMRHSNLSAVLFFDRTGRMSLFHRLASWTSSPALVPEQDSAVAQVLTSGASRTFSEHTFGAELPLLYGAAFLPVTDDSGTIDGVVAVYLDQSELADLSNREFFRLSLLLTVIFTIAMAALLVGYLLMRRRARQSGQQVEYLARYDQLTGLYNRGGFFARYNEMCDKGLIDPAHAAVLYFDLDNFKSVNDTRGHRAGDDILRHVGDAVRSVLEPDDIAGRFGGDEFVVIARTGSLDGAIAFAERLQTLIAQPVHSGGMTLLSGASFGIRFGIVDPTRIEDDIHRADLALYQAKMDGRNICRVFSKELEDRVNRRLKVENAVNRGLEDSLFRLEYQPLVHRATGRCVGFEALLRLTDIDGETISPMEFVPIAEANGAIRKIGDWVLRTAVAEAVTWPEDLFVSVNLSARQFDDEDLLATVRATLRTHGLAPGRLELEVTESELIENTDSVGRQLMDLHALGVSISMDDFGTGYSSLGYLWQYGFDKLKIDRSFILGLDADTERVRDILDTIIVLGHRLNMKVTAEGIETETQARLLSDLSCDQFQGYLYGRPMPPTDLPGFLLKNSFAIRMLGAGHTEPGSLSGEAV